MESYTEFMNDALANFKCRGDLKAKSDAEVLVTKLCEKLDEMGGGGIKTVVIKGVIDERTRDITGKKVYTPNMTYEEARDMILNLEPFNVCVIVGFSPNEPLYTFVSEVRYDAEHNRIVLRASNSSSAMWWSAAGIELAVG